MVYAQDAQLTATNTANVVVRLRMRPLLEAKSISMRLLLPPGILLLSYSSGRLRGQKRGNRQ